MAPSSLDMRTTDESGRGVRALMDCTELIDEFGVQSHRGSQRVMPSRDAITCLPAAPMASTVLRASVGARRVMAFALAMLCMSAGAAQGRGDAALLAWLEETYQTELLERPLQRMSLGLPVDGTSWDDLSDEGAVKRAMQARHQITTLQQRFSDEQLSEQGRLNKRLYLFRLRQRLDLQSCANHLYPMNHFEGIHFEPVSVLVSRQSAASIQDAQAYLQRLKAIPLMLEQLQAAARARANKGHHAPRFTLVRLAEESNEYAVELTKPAMEGNSLLEDFERKVRSAPIDTRVGEELVEEAKRVLTQQVAPAYKLFAETAADLASRSAGDFGLWSQPDGDRCYRVLLKAQTTLDLDPESVHQLGLQALKRSQREFLRVARKLGHTGSFRAFADRLRSSSSSYFSDDEAGRADLLENVKALVHRARSSAPLWFRDFPVANLEVRRVERYREATAGAAFYEWPSADGTKSGVLYVNLRSTKLLPRYELEALVHHEAVPGHHQQVGLAVENKSLPSFRRFDDYTAFSEGWGLYAELLPKEHGFYADPKSDLGRLAFDLRRSARLAVDTGIHAMGWSREEAVRFMLEHTADTEASARDEVDRYFAWPAQATAYKVGALEILRLRDEVRRLMGGRFEIRHFHRVVLRQGTLPLNVLRDEVMRAAQLPGLVQ
jgi:uncharacterized protein (DUF885 family)